jgi:topoisomerase-4 subunit A
VIAIIRTADKPRPALVERFGITEVQADAILDLKLRNLAKLEEIAIKTEQDELSDERDALEKILGSDARMKTLMKKELKAVAEEFGDERRSPIIAREESRAFSEDELLTNDPVTIILSEKGWIRSAKGHDIDPTSVTYKSGDAYRFAARGRSNQKVVMLDSTGKAYTLQAHTLPSARGQGEPLTGRLNAPSGATFEGMLFGDADQRCLLASDAGYGFVTRLGDLQTKNRAGKSVLSLPKGSQVLPPVRVDDLGRDLVVAISNEGRMLAFPVSELPELSRGKGNKIINIPSARVAERAEFVVALAVLSPGDMLIVFAGQRHHKLKLSDLEHYLGDRGRRGNKLPRGFQKVDRIEVERKA